MVMGMSLTMLLLSPLPLSSVGGSSITIVAAVKTTRLPRVEK